MSHTSRAPQPTLPRPAGWMARLPAAWIFVLFGGLALAVAVRSAQFRAWVCDDAFISLRYAENLVRGLGLVFNAGERVEGYSNFLWTMWAAVGMRAGVDPEGWIVGWGAACFAGTVILLAWNAWMARRDDPRSGPWLPLAAVLIGFHTECAIFATGGLETSLFTLQVTLAYVLLASPQTGPGRAAAAGVVLALASMTRPDGQLLAALAGFFVLVCGPHRWRTSLALGGAFLLLWVPFTAWRVGYYGDYFANTYYAKSASLAWYSQGWFYIQLYFQKYWVLGLGVGLAGLAWWTGSSGRARDVTEPPTGWGRRAALATVLALGYTVFVARVGGDFMFGRLLVPVTPLLLVLLELGVARLAGGKAWVQLGAATAAATALVLTPYPFEGQGWVRGIVNEWAVYTPDLTERLRNQGVTLRGYFDGLPVRVAFLGSEARVMYYARPEVAIESQTGLTDRAIARQPLAGRGRIGHEKQASLEYLLDRRAAHVAFHPQAAAALRLDDSIPVLRIDLGGVTGRVLTWDPPLMDALRRRGATFEDYTSVIDRVLTELPRLSDAEVQRQYPLIRRFYFAHVSDPARERPLLERLQRAAGARPRQ